MLLTVAELADHFQLSREAVGKWTTRGLKIDGHHDRLRPAGLDHRGTKLYDLVDAARFDRAARRTLAGLTFHPGRGRHRDQPTPTTGHTTR